MRYTTSELFEACGVLFGPEIDVSLDFLRYLQPSGIKDAYRRQALATHPDRAQILHGDELDLSERFKQVTQAYERLIQAVKGDGVILLQEDAPAPFGAGGRPGPMRSSPRERQRFYTGALPKRELLIGQFLYYSGLISWETLIQAIVQQKRQRPLIGQIACHWGLLSNEDVRQVLSQRRFQERFGDAAMRIGYLDRTRLMCLVSRQKRLQQPLGQFFARYGLTDRLMARLVEKQRRHNRRFGAKPRFDV